MKIIWDENKRLSNLEKHGLDFANLRFSFFTNIKFAPTKENRYIAVNFYNDIKVTVVFAIYGKEALSIISMRLASKKEGQYLQ